MATRIVTAELVTRRQVLVAVPDEIEIVWEDGRAWIAEPGTSAKLDTTCALNRGLLKQIEEDAIGEAGNRRQAVSGDKGRVIAEAREMRGIHLAECAEVRGTTQMCGRAYTVKFRCPVCQKERRINISRNAGRLVRCDGVRIQQIKRALKGGA